MGLEVVLSDGNIIQVRSLLFSHYSSTLNSFLGYDLKQLFIDAEGTLGIVTSVSILTPAAPRASNNVLLAVPDFSKSIPTFKTVREHTSEILSEFDFYDRTVHDVVYKHGHSRPFAEGDEDAQCFVISENIVGRNEHDEDVCFQKSRENYSLTDMKF